MNEKKNIVGDGVFYGKIYLREAPHIVEIFIDPVNRPRYNVFTATEFVTTILSSALSSTPVVISIEGLKQEKERMVHTTTSQIAIFHRFPPFNSYKELWDSIGKLKCNVVIVSPRTIGKFVSPLIIKERKLRTLFSLKDSSEYTFTLGNALLGATTSFQRVVKHKMITDEEGFQKVMWFSEEYRRPLGKEGVQLVNSGWVEYPPSELDPIKILWYTFYNMTKKQAEIPHLHELSFIE